MPLYRFGENELVAVEQRSMAALKIRERQDLQRLLKDNIDVISKGTLVISEEYTGWSGSLRRIDLLGIDPDGTLVVIELKRTEDGGHMELQGIRYAAMASVLTFEDVVRVFGDYLQRNGRSEDAEDVLREHLETEDVEEVAAKVRIVLASADFSQEVTTTVLWLNDQSLDIRCVRMVPYEDAGSVYLDVQQIIPVPEAADYTVRLREKRDEVKARGTKRDMTKYRVTVGAEVLPPVGKGRAILAVVKALCGQGVSPDQMAATIGQPNRQRFYEVEGIFTDEKTFSKEAGASATTNRGKAFRERRYFTADDELIHHEGKTYAFSNQWGTKTEKKMKELIDAHGAGNISFERID
ncbi:endonuclease NucS domain-containing protein [Haloferula sp.]|uniref:endonuclease NucS domain-containing protein n=1 Tax=Haloferula sp. TaxID=2497595 RepID=UPI003C71D9FC